MKKNKGRSSTSLFQLRVIGGVMATAEARMEVHDDVEEATVTRVQVAVGRGIINITLL